MTRSGPLVLLLSVFLIAVSALVYELVAGTVSSYLLGNSITQFSLVIGIFLSAMGIGSYVSQFIEKQLLTRFIQIEIMVGLLGGCSAAILFTSFTYLKVYLPSLIFVTGGIGVMIGLEIPLIIRILKEQQMSLRVTVSNVMTVDYIGGLFAALAFPFILVPHLGLMRTSFIFGLLNVVVAWIGIINFKDEVRDYKGLTFYASAVTLVLVGGTVFSGHLVEYLEERFYPDEIIYAKQTKYQRLIITRWRDDVRLFIDGKLQFSSKDEYRYHEALIHPAMSLTGKRNNVLVLGGGDGLALREIFKYTEVKNVDLVDIDPEITDIFKQKDFLAELSDYALRDPRVNVINDDAMKYLQNTKKTYDVIIMDLPDPNDLALGKLYTKSFFKLAGRRLASDGTIAVQSTSPFFARDAFWCIVNTISSAPVKNSENGTFETYPYHVNVPSFGEWGFTLASPKNLDTDKISVSVSTRFLNDQMVHGIFNFPQDMQPRETKINRLDNQILVKYYSEGYKEFHY
jgi:spermidine synthase